MGNQNPVGFSLGTTVLLEVENFPAPGNAVHSGDWF